MGDSSAYVEKLLDRITTDCRLESVQDDPNSSALIVIKISIERILDELPNRSKLMQLIKTFTYFDEKNLSTELVVACAEAYQSHFATVRFQYLYYLICHLIMMCSLYLGFLYLIQRDENR